MNLLIITQIVDKKDGILGFMHGWIEKFSEKYEKVTVICLFEGEYNLPENVKVLSLGKEGRVSRIKYIFNFYKHIISELSNYQKVFVHMNQIYVILGYPIWKLFGKQIGLWYAHGSVSKSLRVAEKLTDLIITSTESGFRLDSKKKNIIGQGIDINKFKCNYIEKNENRIITVGRISKIKNLKLLFESIYDLEKQGMNFVVDIIGDPIYKADFK
jgi:glycosyltransferase involved in cell wall biosynthesis